MIPDDETWEYEGLEPKDGRAYVCSCFVAALYKAAGLFGDLTISSTEFTPKDVYNLNFYDLNWTGKSKQCQ